MEEVSAAGLGHNSGVPADVVRDELAVALAQHDPRRAELIAAVGRATVVDNDTIGRAGDLRGMIRTLLERVTVTCETIVEPYALATRAARVAQDRWGEALLAADRELAEKIDTCRQRQRDRARAQQEEQRAAENARRAVARAAENEMAAEARRNPPELPPAPISLPAVRGDYGSRTGDRKVKRFEIKDPRKVDLAVLQHPKVQEAMQQACRDLIKIQKSIKGVIVTDDLATTTRK